MIAQTELVERIQAYDAGIDRELIDRAYAFSKKAHGSQKRESGDEYFSHPVQVAGIVAQMNWTAPRSPRRSSTTPSRTRWRRWRTSKPSSGPKSLGWWMA